MNAFNFIFNSEYAAMIVADALATGLCFFFFLTYGKPLKHRKLIKTGCWAAIAIVSAAYLGIHAFLPNKGNGIEQTDRIKGLMLIVFLAAILIYLYVVLFKEPRDEDSQQDA